MTSVQSGFSQIFRGHTKFHAFITPTYDNINEDETPIPFIVNNQVLDINIDNTEVSNFISNGSIPADNPRMQGKLMGGGSLVNALGPNMTTWLRNRITNEESLLSTYTGPLNIYIAPFMTRIQSVPYDQQPTFTSENAYGISSAAPTSTGYVGGGPTDNYLSLWIFKTPLTVQYVAADSSFKYLSLTSQISED